MVTILFVILISCEDRTEQLALMPNKRKINDNELGYRERETGKTRTEKLILDQNNKTEYMVHYRLLKFYVKMGVKVTKTRRVIKFKQDYITYIFKTILIKEQQKTKIKNCYQFRKVRSLKCKVTAECEYKKSTKEEFKTTKTFFNTDYIFNNAIYENGDFTQWLNLEKTDTRVMSMPLSFLD